MHGLWSIGTSVVCEACEVYIMSIVMYVRHDRYMAGVKWCMWGMWGIWHEYSDACEACEVYGMSIVMYVMHAMRVIQAMFAIRVIFEYGFWSTTVCNISSRFVVKPEGACIIFIYFWCVFFTFSLLRVNKISGVKMHQRREGVNPSNPPTNRALCNIYNPRYHDDVDDVERLMQQPSHAFCSTFKRCHLKLLVDLHKESLNWECFHRTLPKFRWWIMHRTIWTTSASTFGTMQTFIRVNSLL